MRFMHQAFRAGVLAGILALMAGPALGQQAFTPPASPRAVYNFNPGWKFVQKDEPGSEAVDFNDTAWLNVSTPHTFNDVDSFDEPISRSGEGHMYQGVVHYRKHFKLPESARGERVVIEFEGMRQAAKFWINGKPVGQYEDGVTAYGLDITDAVNFGDKENILSVWLTNETTYKEEASGVAFQWESKDFNPVYGGINRNVRLHLLPQIHQTLPLRNGLKTTGTYIYGSDFNIAGKKATINIESQVKNGSDSQAAIDFSAFIVDAAGVVRAQIKGETYDMDHGEQTVLKGSGELANAHFWSPDDPYLYSVYTVLTVQGKVVDVMKTTTGFRKAELKGGAGTGGTYINDQFVYLKGYAQRTVNEWAAVGAAYPDWMHDFDMKMQADAHSNYMRWMHVAPRRQEVDACDKYGIVQVCPAGDKEANPSEGQWKQRVEVMKDTIIYYRNSPSIVFWEAGNSWITPARMQEMVDIRKELDPSGGRGMGCRTLQLMQDQVIQQPTGDNVAYNHIAEWFGVMIAQADLIDQRNNPKALYRAYSEERRDLAPFLETEDFRDECLRMYWDKYSPPSFGFKKGAGDTYDYNQETFALAGARRYNDYWSNRISNTDPAKARWSAYASIIWADSNQHGRQPDSEVCRTSGKVDAVRLPKELYYVHRVMQNEKSPDIHIIGHWTYPAGTKKTMYVAASNVDGVELFVNGTSKGKATQPKDGFIYSFPDVTWEAGTIKAVGMKGGSAVTTHELKTAGPAVALKLTPYVGPQGLLADGADIAFFDIEAVDAQGNRCPTDEARVDFELSGPAIWRGGVNEHIVKSTNNTYLNTECGINRVFIRSTFTPGPITLLAKRNGLKDATVTVESKPFAFKDGLATVFPQQMAGLAKP